MLSEDFYRRINISLSSSSIFDCNDFILEVKESTDRVTAKLNYKYKETYYFHFTILKKKVKNQYDNPDFKFMGIYSPGEVLKDENFELIGEDYLLRLVESWLKIMEKELSSIPINRQVLKHEEDIDNIMTTLNEAIKKIPDNYLTPDEISKYEEKLEEVKNHFEGILSEQFKDQNELKVKIAALEKEINALKTTLNSLSKQKWSELLVARLISFIRKNKVAIKLTGTLIKQMLPEAGVIDDVLDDVIDNVS